MTAIGRRAARLEHRLTRANASLAELDAAVALAIEHDCAAVTVNPWLVKAARRALGRERMRLGTIVGYGSGTQILAVKAFEASKALEQGANQIDCVLNAGAMLSGDDEIVYNDMLAVVDMAHSALAVAGVIVEAEPMNDDLVSRACRIAERAGADYVVTSWGEAAGPAHRPARGAAARQRGSARSGQGVGPFPHAGRRPLGRLGRRRPGLGGADARARGLRPGAVCRHGA